MYLAKSRLGKTLNAAFPAALATTVSVSVLASQFAGAADYVRGLEVLQTAAGTGSVFSDAGYATLYAVASIVQANAGLLAFAATPLLFTYLYRKIAERNAELYVAAKRAETQKTLPPPEVKP